MTDKVLKPIPTDPPNYYFARSDGKIYSVKTGLFLELKPSVNGKGYSTVSIFGKTKYVHRLVMEAFYGPSKLVVNHRDGKVYNNSVDNLEYCTISENVKHASRTGLRKRPWLPKETVLLIRKHLALNEYSLNEIAEIFDTTHRVIRLISEGKNVIADDDYY